MIELHYFDRNDFDQLIGWVKSPVFNVQWSGDSFNYPLDKSQLEEYIKDANHEHSDMFIYKVIYKATGAAIGHLSLGRIDRKHQSARIGRVLVGDGGLRGKGIGENMMKEVLRIAFTDLNMHRVSLGVFDFNKGAIACYEKVGFQKEGLLRDFRKIGEEYWNMWEMSILEEEWRERKDQNR
ncbi:RimJ/RimL family protein N-acetyltransferase [Bacillus mesophilus]|uniref:GNAT family N-acetyltransferase n=1 Tax=Bacillus mesophilus TaxID=1808955 RepID=A0A6M0Q8K8_9BACI|nr:GNAT family protein [Bacillus mesophilus]MBM7660602.1 RimJ/RimL family protein N-acetyltransferase [Bacillus mesophilus]NEY71850.1 GNAT family N-acetyltransferase [Bacillus mesophilus]